MKGGGRVGEGERGRQDGVGSEGGKEGAQTGNNLVKRASESAGLG